MAIILILPDGSERKGMNIQSRGMGFSRGIGGEVETIIITDIEAEFSFFDPAWRASGKGGCLGL